ncbi:sialidase family protein [Dactylosporangium sp. NPDC049140]|uniref:sialidase family protein n=1 Tax=Dactylosporangium sp. NPDC049140 TaxID=3155647 RepID=UPI0033E1B650
MRRTVPTVAALALVAGALVAPTTANAASEPRWISHIKQYPGGISNGVRAMYAASGAGAAAANSRAATQANAGGYVAAPKAAGGNVQMNDDSNPPLPQNETAVAYNVNHPLIAVAAANDYVSGGVVVMRTTDGGKHWASTRITPQFRGTGDFCNGGDPGVAYSRRDGAFYLSQLCFFRSQAYSEIQVYKSVDNGQTWTPGRQAARAASNYDYTTGTVDESIFNDKELIAVDNTPTSPHYGRLYVTYTKFHLQPDGFSDYCPLQLSYTDTIPTENPALTTWAHTAIQPDNPGGDGTGLSANQFSVPVVEQNGALDIGFVSEECNASYDPHLLFQKSTDGGATFLPQPVQIDKPGQYADFLDDARDDTLPPTAFRAPNTVSLAYSPRTGTLLYVYQNNINRPLSAADISYQTSADGGLHWSDSAFLSTGANGTPARNDQFLPWAASDENGRFYAIWFDRRQDPANVRINTWQAVSGNNAASFTSAKISTKDWDPNLGFLGSGAFIGDYNGLAASTKAVYPVWTDGRDSAIAQTGIGETDIFTNVEINP